MKRLITAKQIMDRNNEMAANLSTETKQIFWKAMFEDGLNVGEARAIAGIDDLSVAAALVLQCHEKIYIPMKVDNIK